MVLSSFSCFNLRPIIRGFTDEFLWSRHTLDRHVKKRLGVEECKI